jgi:hypothetical protein
MLKEPLYRHRQLPLWFALMMVAFIGYGVFILLIIDSKQVFWLWNGFTILLAVFFWGLAVEVNQDEVRLSFGIGLIKKTILRELVVDVEQVRNSWWYGWGIRLTPHGWMWNISGLDAVELTYRNGKKFRIGTDEPEMLLGVLKTFL